MVWVSNQAIATMHKIVIAKVWDLIPITYQDATVIVTYIIIIMTVVFRKNLQAES